MSMSLKPNIHRLLVILPALLFVVSLGVATWFGLRVQDLPVGRDLLLPATLTRVPEDAEQASRIRLVHSSGGESTNPFAPSSAPGDFPGTLGINGPDLLEIHLTMVARGGEVRLCMINGKLIGEGKIISGVTVKEVKDRGVLLQRGKEEFFLLPGQKAVFARGRLREILEVRNLKVKTASVHSTEVPGSEEVDNGSSVPAQ